MKVWIYEYQIAARTQMKILIFAWTKEIILNIKETKFQQKQNSKGKQKHTFADKKCISHQKAYFSENARICLPVEFSYFLFLSL